MTFWERAESFPPILCRLLARHPYGKPLTTFEIYRDGDMWNEYTANQISKLTDWSTVEFGDMRRFLTGCRLDFENSEQMRRVDDYLRKKPTFRYLRSSPDFEYFRELMWIWRRAYPLDPPEHLDPNVRALIIRLTPLLNNAGSTPQGRR